MKPPPEPRSTPYWLLIPFIGLLVLPYSWASMALIAAAVVVGVATAIREAAGRRRTEAARAAEGQGMVIGVDPRGAPVYLSDRQLAAHGLIVGASGAGKTTTLLGLLTDQIRRGRPVVAIDLKGSPAFVAELERAAAGAGRPFRLWTPDGPGHWNPLAHGNATSLKDKLIASERFTEPHYQRAAERYVQTVFGVVRAAHPGSPARLTEVVALMEPKRLAGTAATLDREIADRVQDYISGLTRDQLSAVHGLGTRLAILSESHAGPFLEPPPAGGGPEIDLRHALDGGEVVVFSLNSSLYGKLAAQLGTLAIQDLVSTVGHRLSAAEGSAPVQAVIGIDEFSALGADNLLALLARGREAGAAVVVATQELADLDRAAPGFRDQVLGITSLKIAHRQEVPSSAQTISQLIGTEWAWEETSVIQSPFAARPAARGTRRQVERPIVHPNEIKRLQTGQAVLITTTPRARATHLRITPPRPGAPRAGGDQPAPGVTR